MNTCYNDALKSGFNNFSGMSSFGNKIIEYLMLNNEVLWKLLKYNDNNALEKDNLTLREKSELIYMDEGSAENYKVFRDKFIDDMFDQQTAQIRIFIEYITPVDRSKALVDIGIQVLVHPKINTLSNGYNRQEVISENILSTLNGAPIEGCIGQMFFDATTSRYNNYKIVNYNNRNFSGPTIIMSLWCGNVNE